MLIVGADHRGEILAKDILHIYSNAKYYFSTDYPDIVHIVAKKMKNNNDYAILICKTGVGMSIGINRYSYIRGALVNTIPSVRMARKHNNINVLCIGADTIQDNIIEMIKTMFDTAFEAGRHEERLQKI